MDIEKQLPSFHLKVTFNTNEQTLGLLGGSGASSRAVQYGSKYDIFEHPTTVSVAQITGCKNFSEAQLLRSGKVEASDWGCNLQIMEGIPHNISHVGIRAHQISFTNDPNQENTLPCWLVRTSETPHRMTIRTPPRDALLSHGASQIGRGFGFGLHEAMDQTGAVMGPLAVAAMLYFQGEYRNSFAILIVPAVLGLLVLFIIFLIFYTLHPTPKSQLYQGFAINKRAIRVELLQGRQFLFLMLWQWK